MRRKDLESLRTAISHHESNLGQGQPEDDDLSDHGAGRLLRLRWLLPQKPMALLQGAPRLNPLIPLQPKAKLMPWRWMTRDGGPPPASPVSPADDDLLTSSGVVGVEGDMANLMVSSPKDHDGGGKDTSV